ncbi:STAS domain-containing protein [Acidovorax sp. PRC11]|nr:STAS domain-containing protein [Acidovorax sp. PRC11]MDT0137486.1 STAS domain-containing protein [Acidovorax sp. PRC11]
MSKEESSRGLLSKVVRFVRNPTVNWNELDSIDEDRESQYSKQVLKEMIERKRRNDFVRRREFDQLRKLRQREALHGQQSEDPAARASFFHTSITSPDDRAVTLKKIDEIEAQMSQQWWKGKQSSGATSPGTLAPPPPAAPGAAEADADIDAVHARAFAPTAPASLPAHLAQAGVQPLFSGESIAPPAADFGAATEPLPYPGAAASGASFPVSPPLLTERAEPQYAPAPAAQPEPFVHEPDLEEAAILFANGDHAGAEAALLDVLRQHEGDGPERQAEFWMALFDLYRAIGEHERFESLAIDFAARFGRSAPLWFSVPELLGLQVAAPSAPLPASASAGAAAPAREFVWNAPSVLAPQSVAALQASVARAAASPWTFVWTRLMSIEEPALPALAQLFGRWADGTDAIVFKDVDALSSLLEARTPSGDRGVAPDWWRLRMAALRLMGRPDEFELVALDYCVTYEVSPPSWAASRCSYSDDGGTAGGSAAPSGAAGFEADAFSSGFGEPSSRPSGLEEAAPAAMLSGHIEGDATPMLEPLEAHMRAGVPFAIGCDRLARVDFAAAGSVLNWTAAHQDQGHVVQFTQMPRLVAVFFNVIGINEHALIVPRRN